jgi:DNA-binding CsgD family transcriptional regulator
MAATAAIGATASVYTAAIPESQTEASSFTLFACHPGFAQDLHASGQLLKHPWVRFAQTHTIPGTDQQIALRHGPDVAAIELARQYGFRSCLVVPTPSGVNLERLEMLCLGSDQEAAFEGEDARMVRTLARALAAELHDWMTGHLKRRLREAAQLQPADVDLLALEWQGCGTKEIALHTGLSTAAVDSRFRRMNKRLGCSNRKDSARRAAAHGLLEPG